MDIGQLFESKYLKKEDVPHPIVVSITSVAVEQLKRQGGGTEKKGILFFSGGTKPMVLNVGNGKVLTDAYGRDTDKWIGRSIEIYVNPNIEMGGQVVGGLRLRLPTGNHQTLGSSIMNLPMAVQALAAVGVKKEMLIQVLKSKGLSGYLPLRDTETVLAMIKEAQESPREESFDDPMAEETGFGDDEDNEEVPY